MRLIEFDPPLIIGNLIRREKRFFGYIRLLDGTEICAHCPNTGRMTGALGTSRAVAVSPANNPKRKLQYTWELAATELNELSDSERHAPRSPRAASDKHQPLTLPTDVCWSGINTHRANQIIEAVLRCRAANVIPALGEVAQVRREVVYAAGHRADFAVSTRGQRADDSPSLIEVKNVHISRTRGVAEFPDSVTARGTKHMNALAKQAAAGIACHTIFCVQRSDCSQMRLAADIDPEFAAAAMRAHRAGVSFCALAFHMETSGISMVGKIPIVDMSDNSYN